MDDVTKAKIEVINDAGRSSKALLFSFLAACAYVFAAVAATNDRDILIGRLVLLPVLGSQTTIPQFFMVAPLLVLALHFYTLLNYYSFSLRLRSSGLSGLEELRGEELYLEPSLLVSAILNPSISPSLRTLLRHLVVILLMILPVVLLLLIQIRFIPYHNAWITSFHQIGVIADLALLWSFLPIIRGKNVNGVSRCFGILGTLVAFGVSGIFAVGPGNGLETRMGWTLPFHRLRDIDVSVGSLAGETASTPPSLSGRDLRRAKLRGISLVGADLQNVDFRGACLARADLRRADLRGAKLSWANLSGARMDGVRLEGSDLRFANLTGARIRLADFSKADLRDATLDRANLSFSRFDEAKLDLARMKEIDAFGSSFNAARLVGADLLGAKLGAVAMQAPDIRGARFFGAELWASEWGGSFYGDGQDLRGGNLEGGVNKGPRKLGVDPKDGEGRATIGLWETRRKLLADAVERARKGTVPADEEEAEDLEALALGRVSRVILLSTEGKSTGFQDGEALVSGEEAIGDREGKRTVAEFARQRVSEACKNSALAQSLVRAAVGCQNPVDETYRRAVAEELLGARGRGCLGVMGFPPSYWAALAWIMRGEAGGIYSNEVCGFSKDDDNGSC